MLEKINLFAMAGDMAIHAGTRQAVIAQNIANADTPDYKARDVTPFADLLRDGDGDFRTRATRDGHLHGARGPAEPEIFEKPTGVSNPNGNQVALEDEMLKAVEVKRQHDRALAIYRSGLTILRSSLGRG